MSVFVLLRKKNQGSPELVFTVKENNIVEAKRLIDQLNLLTNEELIARFIPS